MQINLYLNNIEKEISDIKDIIKLCKTTNNLDKIEILENFLTEMKLSFNYPTLIKEKFIPELSKNNEYMGIVIFESTSGDNYIVDILVNGLNKDIEQKYGKIYDMFCEQNDMEFNINICNYSIYDFDELENYDCLVCLVDDGIME